MPLHSWPRHSDSRWLSSVAPLIAALGGGVLLYFWREARPMWVDEEMLAINIRDLTLAEFAGPLWLGQAAPFGWLALERMAMLVLGVSERAMRALPVLLGLLTLVGVVVTGRRWLDAAGTIVLALLVAFSSYVWHFALELKHYSADTLGGLAVPVLAAWAASPTERHRTIRRAHVWWIVAGLLQWTSFGALFAAPACGFVLVALSWRRWGRGAALRAAAFSAFWLACVGLHYYASIRHVSANEYLYRYWASSFPQDPATLSTIWDWLTAQLASIARNPVGTRHVSLFWLVSAVGMAAGMYRRSTLAFMLATTLPSAVLFGLLGLVPFSDRLTLWVLPALYASIGFAAMAAVDVVVAARARQRWLTAVPGVGLAVLVGWLSTDIVSQGIDGMRLRRSDNAHGLDDRGAVGTLMSARRPGDAMIVTHLGLPAVWWYAGVDLSATSAGASFPDGGAIFEISEERAGTRCRPEDLRQALEGLHGATLYLGFELGDNLLDLALDQLSELGAITRYQLFGVASHIAVIDLDATPSRGFVRPGMPMTPPPVRHEGCIRITSARPW